MFSSKEICIALNIDYNNIVNIYSYGSHVYDTATEKSDYDYIIVFKQSLLPSGAFKDNAISSSDRKIQGVCYSRCGFIDAINNYQIAALECLFLPDDKIVQKKMEFKMQYFRPKDIAKKIISTASSSWHNAQLAYNDNDEEYAKKNVYHAIRILEFGIQILKHQRIINYNTMHIKTIVYNDTNFKPNNYNDLFINTQLQLKSFI